MRLLVFSGLLFFLAVFPFAGVAEPVALSVDGSCRDFTATVGLPEPGCYDVKVDVTTAQGRGQVYDPRAGWKSSVYYVEQQCANGQLELRLRAPAGAELNFKAGLRAGGRVVWESEFVEVGQRCAESVEWFVLPALGALLLIAGGLAWEKRAGQRKRK